MFEKMAYIKKLYSQELGYRKGIPKKAGRYFFISKEFTGYFPPLSTVIENDFTILNVVPPNSDNIVLTKYVYHNSKLINDQSNGRNEYRIYLNSALENNIELFKLEDIVVICKMQDKKETEGIYYKIYHFSVDRRNGEYSIIEEILNRFSSSRNKGKFTLAPVSELPFNINEINHNKIEKIVPATVQDAVLNKPFELIPKEQLEKEYTFTRHIREGSFQELVKFFYEYKCAVTDESIYYQDLYNIEAAHIIPYSHRGPSHPQNGIALCRDMHWAFDKGFFTLNDEYKIQIHEKVIDQPKLCELNNKKINLPSDRRAWPSMISIKYHRENVYGIFQNSR